MNKHIESQSRNTENSTRITPTTEKLIHVLFNNSNSNTTTPDFSGFFKSYVNTLRDNQYKRILLSLYILTLLFGTVINLVLIHTIIRLRNPKSLANRRMLLTRVLCDLTLAWFGVPYTAYTAVYKNWLLGGTMCKIAAFFIYFVVALNNFLLVSICLNRSVAISQNGKRLNDRTSDVPCRVKCLLAGACLLALIIALPGGIVSEQTQILPPPKIRELVELHKDVDDIIPKMCIDSWGREAQLAYDVILIVSIYLIPLFVVCFSQHVVTVRLKQSQRLLMLTGHRNTLAWTRRRQRLTRLCVLMAGLFVLSWSPNHICNLLIKTFHINNPITEIILDYSLCLAMSNAVTGPLLLIATCSNYHRYILKLLTGLPLARNWRSTYVNPTASVRFSVSATAPTEILQNDSNRNGLTRIKLKPVTKSVEKNTKDNDLDQTN